MALHTMIGRIQAAQEKVNKEAAQTIAEAIAKLLPEGAKLSWDQYTEYWNDGEPCTFSVYDWELTTLDGHRIGEYWNVNPEVREAHASTISAIKEAWKLFERNDSVFQNAFGDHISVTVYPDGRYETQSCSHE